VIARHKPGVAFLIESLSVGGAKLIGPLTVGRGERISILFEVDHAPVEVAAEVIRAESFDLETDHVAVRFIGMTDTSRRLIRDLVSQILDLEGDDPDDEAEERVIEVE
jgi:hypothetical protein